MDQAQDDNIDLFSVFETLWDGKWKIIFFIFVSSIASISYLSYTPNSFKVTTKLQQSSVNLYFKYKYLNDILEMDRDINDQLDYYEVFNNEKTFENNKPVLKQTFIDDSFSVDSPLIFEMFINEFNDYEEMVTVLSENDYVKDKIKKLNDNDKRKALINFAKNFVIIKPYEDAEFREISFTWHKINEGIFLFNKALNLTLINVQKSLLMEIDNLANSIDLANQRKKDSFNILLKSIRELNEIMRIKRTRYLTEQSDIAKELGIEKNQLDKLTIESPDYPYYLRGFKAIDKELDLIKSRSGQDNDLMSKGYLSLKRKLILIENDIRSKQLRVANEMIKKDNISKWVNFNLELAEMKSNKKPLLYILFSIIIGGVLGAVYVLISKAQRERKNLN